MQAPRKWSRPTLAAKATAGEAFVAHMRAALEQIGANATGAAAGRDPEYLHQLRVGVRRLRSTLHAFRGLLRRRRARRFDRELRAILRSMGAVRDWDTFLHSRISARLRQVALRHRAEALRAMRNVATPLGLSALSGRLLVWVRGKPWRNSADPGEPLGDFGVHVLRRLDEAARDAAEGIDWADAERRHRVRIRVKRLRYGCDCFRTAFPPEAMDAFQHRLEALQQLLGDLNDFAVQRRLLGELARDRGVADAAEGTRTRLGVRERRLVTDLEKAWSKFEAHPPHWRREAARARH